MFAGQEPIQVRFEQTSYQAAPDQPFAVNVLISPPTSGLFSYGVRLTFPSISLSAAASDAIIVPSPIDFNGSLGAGAFRQIEAGSLAVKGTVRPDPLVEPYKAGLLATFNLQAKGVAAGQGIPLVLDVFRTLGDTETVFVDGSGNDLDNQISFGSAVVTVVPEPAPWLLLAGPIILTIAGRFVLHSSFANT